VVVLLFECSIPNIVCVSAILVILRGYHRVNHEPKISFFSSSFSPRLPHKSARYAELRSLQEQCLDLLAAGEQAAAEQRVSALCTAGDFTAAKAEVARLDVFWCAVPTRLITMVMSSKAMIDPSSRRRALRDITCDVVVVAMFFVAPDLLPTTIISTAGGVHLSRT
jgi:hypothetical protein